MKPPAPAAPPTQQQLADWSQRRRLLIHTRTAETNRVEHYIDPLCKRQSRQLLKLLEMQRCDQAIAQLLSADAALAHKAEPFLKAFYLRPRAAAKKPLVALTAVNRELIIRLNRLRKNEQFQFAA